MSQTRGKVRIQSYDAVLAGKFPQAWPGCRDGLHMPCGRVHDFGQPMNRDGEAAVPTDPESERAVIGLMLDFNADGDPDGRFGPALAGWRADIFATVRAIVQPDDFESDGFQAVYRAACAIHDRDEPVTVERVWTELLAMPARANTVHGFSPTPEFRYVLQAASQEIYVTTRADWYAARVHDTAERRRLLRNLGRLTQIVYDPRVRLADVLKTAREMFGATEAVRVHGVELFA